MDLEAILALYERHASVLAEAVSSVYLHEDTMPTLRAALPAAEKPEPRGGIPPFLAGIPIRFDPELPHDVIEFRRRDGAVVNRIELAH